MTGPVLFFTSLYPGTWSPVRGLFVYELRAALGRELASGGRPQDLGSEPVAERSEFPGVLPDRAGPPFWPPVVAPISGWDRLHAASPAFAFAGEGESSVARPVFWTLRGVGKRWDGRFMAAFSRAAFRRAIAAWRPQLVHAHYAYPDAEAAALLAEEAGLPLVVTVHGSDVNVLAATSSRRERIIRVLRQARAVVGVSQALCGSVREMGVPSERIFTIANGVNTDNFFPASPDSPMEFKDRLAVVRNILTEGRAMAAETEMAEDASVPGAQPGSQTDTAQRRPILLAVGRLEPVKGYDRLLEALALLRKRETVYGGSAGPLLVFAGEGGQKQRLAAQARALGLGGNVMFAGAVSHTQLAQLYSAADALVLSSYSEGWPTVAYEAMACGTPMVAPAVGGIPDILAPGGLGVLVPDNAPPSLARGVETALATTWERSRLVAEARAHSWRTVARAYLDVYRRVV